MGHPALCAFCDEDEGQLARKSETEGEVKMKLIGENLNIMSNKYGKAFERTRCKDLARVGDSRGGSRLGLGRLNIGPAGKTGVELMSWLGAGGP